VQTKERFGANLSRERGRLGWSQEDLSRQCGLHITAISRIERGTREPRLETIVKLAKGLGIPAGRLLDGLGASG
jgi:transcriptional regulator with XRE-family HTH domain